MPLFLSSSNWSTAPTLKKVNNIYYYYQNDYLGTPNIIHDKQGLIVNAKEIDAFGKSINIVNTKPDNFGFSGQYLDNETQTYYNFNRNYDQKTGRYLQLDPIKILGGENLYLYTLNNPINRTDSTGLFFHKPFEESASDDCFDCLARCALDYLFGDDLQELLLNKTKEKLRRKMKKHVKREVVKKMKYVFKKVTFIIDVQGKVELVLCIGRCY